MVCDIILFIVFRAIGILVCILSGYLSLNTVRQVRARTIFASAVHTLLEFQQYNLFCTVEHC